MDARMMTMKRNLSVILIMMLAFICFAGLASAHVKVFPAEVTKGSYEQFTIRVPSEKEDAKTVMVKLRVPEGVSISRTEPRTDWSEVLEKDANGKITSITWKAAEGMGLSSTQFTEFKILGKVNKDATKLSWKAYQTYSDKSVVEWVGAPDSDTPGPVTTVIDGAVSNDGHGVSTSTSEQANTNDSVSSNSGTAASTSETATDTSETTANASQTATDTSVSPDSAVGSEAASASKDSNLSLYLSIVAVVLGAAALLVALVRRNR